MYNPNNFFQLQGQSTKIVNGKLVDNNKWKIFSDNAKRFQGKINILNQNKEYKIRDFKLNDLSNILKNKTNEILNLSKTKKRRIKRSNKDKKKKHTKKIKNK
tara:strand:+ start:300 stop:605 length:306 start_codon:yes stop_codon:yes gene_type:complete